MNIDLAHFVPLDTFGTSRANDIWGWTDPLTGFEYAIGGPVAFDSDADYLQISSGHNLAINEETGYAYVVGSNTCRGGLHMIDIRKPKQPVFAGCYDADGYTHDPQCVIYHGPDQTEGAASSVAIHFELRSFDDEFVHVAGTEIAVRRQDAAHQHEIAN